MNLPILLQRTEESFNLAKRHKLPFQYIINYDGNGGYKFEIGKLGDLASNKVLGDDKLQAAIMRLIASINNNNT